MSRYILQAQELLQRAHLRPMTPDQRKDEAIKLAGYMLSEANRVESASEKRKQKQLARMVTDPSGKIFATRLTDQCFRSHNQRRVADQICSLVQRHGIPRFLSWMQKFQLWLFSSLAPAIGQYVVPLIRRVVRNETSTVILSGDPKELRQHIGMRTKQGVRVNLNHLGEAILGEEEAQKRLQVYLKDLSSPDVEYISVKVSTLYSQINLLGWEQTVEVLTERLRELYRAAKNHHFIDAKGNKVPKFVNLDMEEYRDVRLTATLFTTILEDPEFYDFSAGIVLQAYLPDAFLLQQELTTWAMQRVAHGGAPIKIRLVKGANLAMEKVEASLKGWSQAPYHNKSEVDANYKRMMMYGCESAHASAVRLGIASHNLFDIAFGMLLRQEEGVVKYVSFEMLEGMAEALRQVVQTLAGGILLYCPTATEEEFQYAVAYLTRRLDENTAPENFLRHLFDLKEGSDAWKEQINFFTKACAESNAVPYVPQRRQNHLELPRRSEYHTPFVNEPDTDWSLPQNRKWAERIHRSWAEKAFQKIPIVIDDVECFEGCRIITREDPSIPNKEIYSHALADRTHIDKALSAATKHLEVWKQVPLQKKCRLLDEVAYLLQCRRNDLIGVMTKDTGKTFAEGDVEVSEAIDFANYYRRNVEEVGYLSDIELSPKGVVLIAPPWNFPCSIPAGGIIAALAAGNVVLFKPAPEAVWVGWELAKIFWDAGFDKKTLQFLCCEDDTEGSSLIKDPRISAVVLTGATATAKKFMELRPGIHLMAETGGKNAMIITAASDRDLAIRDLLQSAFGHAGQKCSACSLAILEKEVYEDPQFLEQLQDAAKSLKVGSAWDLSTKVNPLIRIPTGPLLRGLTTLEPGEEWLLQPTQDPTNPKLWSPGIKLGVQPGSFTHKTELFGPVLGLMCAENLDEAIALANGTPYGLTSGLHSLDEREHSRWLPNIIAGNCYINRGITGAIVQRQPFGGCKDSSFGPGVKAGGPNYVLQLMQVKQIRMPDEREPINDAVLHMSHRMQDIVELSGAERNVWMSSVGSYAFYWNHYFSQDHDPSLVLGQDNILRYVIREDTRLRVNESDSLLDVVRAVAAVLTCQGKMDVSAPESWQHLKDFVSIVRDPTITIRIESDEVFCKGIHNFTRMRFLSDPKFSILQACASAGITAIVSPILANGRLELLHNLREISISYDYHRYGYLGEREVLPKEKQQGCCQKGRSCSCS